MENTNYPWTELNECECLRICLRGLTVWAQRRQMSSWDAQLPLTDYYHKYGNI